MSCVHMELATVRQHMEECPAEYMLTVLSRRGTFCQRVAWGARVHNEDMWNKPSYFCDYIKHQGYLSLPLHQRLCGKDPRYPVCAFFLLSASSLHALEIPQDS